MSFMFRVIDAPKRSFALYHARMKCPCFLACLYQCAEVSFAGWSTSISLREDIPSRSPGKIQDMLRLTCDSRPEGGFLHSLINLMVLGNRYLTTPTDYLTGPIFIYTLEDLESANGCASRSQKHPTHSRGWDSWRVRAALIVGWTE